MLRRERVETMRGIVVRVLATRLLAFFACAALVGVGHVLVPGPAVTVLPAEVDRSEGVPAWTIEEGLANPDCVPMARWRSGTPATVVVRRTDGARTRIAFGTAWRLNHDAATADDVWVLAGCP